ncbi:glycosyltransferase family 39 protein [Svornostia abyssi]|uniref:Glycosyltransferase family 39 protein n=1 Tax=Svornostia abyssi TaxID=2898438 RepID=A0ABY5PFE5_9ACTN|nr:glycosyltransferase family 39 protein [Parviterribacteraceae bacterium J379]
MSSVAARPEPVQRLRAGSLATVLTILGLIALSVISLLLRTQALRAGFWIDEGLSVGIATRDFWDIPGVLRMDGSPPLYYMLLHLWMAVVGNGEGETHGLSVVFAVGMVPVAWWAARGLAGNRAAWMAAVLAAFHPFLTFYAQETRMYALAALLALLFAGCFARAYALEDRRYIAPVAITGALLLYTHNWSIFLLAGSVAALAALWWGAPDRRAFARDAALGYGGIGLLFLPWVPTLLYQAAHTGAPWARKPGTEQLLEGAFTALGSGGGGGGGGPLLLIVAGAGVAAMLGRPLAGGGAGHARGREDTPRPGGPRARRPARGGTPRRLAGVPDLPGVDEPLSRGVRRPRGAAGRDRPGADPRARHRGARRPRLPVGRSADDRADVEEQRPGRRGEHRVPPREHRRPRDLHSP